ncbi:metalloregulator ArsR/SmtB family transcription factor [Parvibaculum sp.]|uniref:ArsR/SmtB family transcription factor n=1 Tax=Parvibaculum sp. TaxID=2024848 RepID=UPI000C3D705E|nr:metalloregulator ArsR/SmtB family transcription factor [Parvibaculum sp.]HAC59637.1 ArsR family transcriptional regulator [Rhodobiaceae bacterium]MAU59353.1 ArsR family transcriptional regulator [Parvibaculum sp.]MBO6668126.1 helix-turn-helix transcriptional regulator [Parvibaculum sp.]MBO6692952.1 helix-turn-helix transcriptional regulator [Parvibaculum sp.]MBO6715558.1 helix-turn-helix transcriptional regulator [Parvibaculum sp.]|tara:strand:- start:936 stop:1283 length:348 start_codon:yes stop_codon:yes gene_type:complete
MQAMTTADISELEASASEASQLLGALANERRLLILCHIAGEEMSVGEIQSLLGISQSALSQHLAVLREQGLVATRRASQTIYYRLASPEAQRIIETLADIYCPPSGKGGKKGKRS